MDYGQVALPSAPPVWKEDATLKCNSCLPFMWMNQRCERWQSRMAMSLCPQLHLLSHHTNHESLTSRPIIIWDSREAGCRVEREPYLLKPLDSEFNYMHQRLSEGLFLIMVKVRTPRKNLSS